MSAGRARRFRYQADALCVAATILYALNRWALKPHAGPGFFHDHFNDLLLLPAGLPWVLWVQARCGWRPGDPPPTSGEIFAHVAAWSVVCEWAAPRWLPHGTGDWADAASYAAGGALAWWWWNRSRARPAGA